MSAITFKQFALPKSGLGPAECADSVEGDAASRRFAIADGVTRSYFPQFVAQALTREFVEDTEAADGFLSPPAILSTLEKAIAYWDEECIREENEADEFMKDMLEVRREQMPYGATTFAGLEIGDEEARLVVLGDSCIFFIPDDGERMPAMFTSMPSQCAAAGTPQWFSCEFGTRPHFIDTGGRIVGTPLTDSFPLADGTILMMTDALAEWFVNNFRKDNAREIMARLHDISGDDDFRAFVESERALGLHDDDTSMILIRIGERLESGEPETVPRRVYLPALPPAPLAWILRVLGLRH